MLLLPCFNDEHKPSLITCVPTRGKQNLVMQQIHYYQTSAAFVFAEMTTLPIYVQHIPSSLHSRLTSSRIMLTSNTLMAAPADVAMHPT